MRLPVMPPVSPMLAKLTRELPEDEGLLYEPKWDGFRGIVFRDGEELEIGSRNDRPLTRYFPELAATLAEQLPPRVVLDGEVVIAGANGLDFEALQMRLHPAASRVQRLARETPASFIAFDLLALGDSDLREQPLRDRRAQLEVVMTHAVPPLLLTPTTADPAIARDWFRRFEGAGLDGVIAKPRDLPYREGERVMFKVKHERTADCVVGGYRVHKDGAGVGSLLLGLFDGEGTLHHVGVATSFAAAKRRELLAELEAYRERATVDHPWSSWMSPEAHELTRLPGGISRWTGNKDLSWVPVRAELVVEVTYGQLLGHRFRHATQLKRFRPDRTPASCTYDQLDEVAPAELMDLFTGH